MRFWVKILFVLSSPAFCAEGPSSVLKDGRLTLDAAKQYAAQHNYEVRARRFEYEQALAEARRARAPFYPRLGLAAGADSLTGNDIQNVGPIANMYVAMNLFSGFAHTAGVRRADVLAERALVQFKQSEFRVGLDVEQEFHSLLFKKCQMEINAKALDLNKKQQKMALVRKASGMAAQSDILEFDQREALLRSEGYAVEQERGEIRSQLRRLLGEEVGESVEPVGHLQHQHLNGTLKDFVQAIQANNESILVGAKDVVVAEADSDIARAGWLPTVDMEVRAGYLSLDYRPASGVFNFLAMGYLKWELFSGFETMAKRDEATKRRLASEARLKDLILSAVAQAEIAFRRIKTIQHRVDLEAQNEDRAQKYYDVVLSEYRRGVRNSADLRMAAESVYSSGNRKIQFQYDFLIEKLKLERALGAPVKTELIRDDS